MALRVHYQPRVPTAVTEVDDPASDHGSAVPGLDEVYAHHAGFVYRVVRRLGVPPSAVEDVMQEVFLVVHRRLPTYDGRAAMTTWLYHLARGVVSNHRRQHEREARRLASVEPLRPGPDPERATEQQRAAAFVRAFLEGLDPDQRRVFELADLEGLTMPEVAEIEGINLNTAYSRLRLARRKFQRAVDERDAVSPRGAGAK
jgi:RNA polymerase sigma-70 factor, ECF subfamily